MSSTSVFARLKTLTITLGELSFAKFLTLLFFGSFLCHLIPVSIFINQPIALDDMFQYDMLARSLKEGNGFRWYSKADVEILRPYYSQFLDIDHLPFPHEGLETTFRAPGYPFFLALIYLLVPGSFRFILARLAQACLVASLAPLAALFCQQLGFSRKVGFLSAIGMSLYPILLFYPIGLASENLYIALGLSSLIAVHFSIKKKSWKRVLLAGLFCGLTMFTRSIFAVFVLLSGIWLWCFNPLKQKAALVFLLTAFGFCLPWSVRNSILMQKPAFVENSAGYNLFIGCHPQGDGGFVSDIAILPMNILDDGEREKFCLQQAVKFIKQDPIEAVRRVFVRLVKFIGPEDREFFYFYSNNLLGAIPSLWLLLIYSLLVIPWGTVLIFGIIGLRLAGDKKVVLLILIFLIGYGLPHLFIIAEPRFHLAWVPVFMPFAMYAWVSRSKIPWRKFLRENRGFMVLLLMITFVFILGLATNFPKLLSVLGEGGNRLFFSY